jgi:hypothetical protein
MMPVENFLVRQSAALVDVEKGLMIGIVGKRHAMGTEDAGLFLPGELQTEREGLPIRYKLDVPKLHLKNLVSRPEGQTRSDQIQYGAALCLRERGIEEELGWIQIEIVREIDRMHNERGVDAVLLEPQIQIAVWSLMGIDRRGKVKSKK